MVRYQGHCVLIDCGEGTQIAAQKAGLSLKPIDKILITHLHADHISGLPGLLLTMGNMGKTSPLSIIGPRGTERTVNALRIIAQGLPFEVHVSELEEDEISFPFHDCDITAYKVYHGVPCYAYQFVLPRGGKFDAARALEQGIPMAHWKRLQQGEQIQEDDVLYTPDMVLGPKRRGLKIAYCTDTRPTPSITKAAKNCDLFICEGMYGEDSMLDKALENRHMLMSEAARIARDAGGVKELWLTHFSPSIPKPKIYRDQLQAIFPETKIPRDGWKKELHFSD